MGITRQTRNSDYTFNIDRSRSLLPIMVVINGVDLDDEYIVRVASYNGSGPTGGDSLTEDLNIWYEVSHFVPEI